MSDRWAASLSFMIALSDEKSICLPAVESVVTCKNGYSSEAIEKTPVIPGLSRNPHGIHIENSRMWMPEQVRHDDP
jgi:hypothetical protein